ncbi:OLC1v1026228C2 [Oldenlandia corymbosa var. corymbosa]|uniref:OLC1v1026228C2 n=1 Tax=Oldenlandia corymbosa var. corymbosa TaxID=529605 RepID=A0AAV1C6N0_OLDCO|nr:OLC1v1026228C2 [Oldenlandia corymbosa var. corymbosa]
MGKSDDSIARRRNKKSRKKEENKVSTRIASIIAAKKRRLTGKRRNCQGMCYSIPTLDDPFNERHGKVDPLKKKKKRPAQTKLDKKHIDKKRALSKNCSTDKAHASTEAQDEKPPKIEKPRGKSVGAKDVTKSGKTGDKNGVEGHIDKVQLDCPSKFLNLCLNSIQNDLQHETAFSREDRPFFVHKWGVEFWKFYSNGKDILEASEKDSTSEQIAWVASCAADTIARKEKEGMSLSSPFLLFIVPSQEKATEVRRVCKPLKALGIHSVSLHPGASINHQIHGLKSCEPEFLISTPERLLELVSLNEINISGVSLLVIDGLESYADNGILNSVKVIKKSISGTPQTVVFSDGSNDLSTPVLQNLLRDSFCLMS